jgi:hypothetical protein
LTSVKRAIQNQDSSAATKGPLMVAKRLYNFIGYLNYQNELKVRLKVILLSLIRSPSLTFKRRQKNRCSPMVVTYYDPQHGSACSPRQQSKLPSKWTGWVLLSSVLKFTPFRNRLHWCFRSTYSPRLIIASYSIETKLSIARYAKGKDAADVNEFRCSDQQAKHQYTPPRWRKCRRYARSRNHARNKNGLTVLCRSPFSRGRY